MRPIFCGNFEYDARQSDLERLFRRYGKVDRVDMKSGFAFVYMEDERDAEDAIRALDRIEFGRKERRLRVEWTKQERNSRQPDSSRKSSSKMRPSKTLFVINFDPYHTKTNDLERHFGSYGKILNVRIRRNFAFVQFETEEDAIKALDATNMSKLLDRVITVEFAIKDDDERRSGNSPGRAHNRSPRRGYDRARSRSPRRRERDSPDYGHDRHRNGSPYGRERASPDYGHGRGRDLSPYRRDRASPDYVRRSSRSPYRKGSSRSPYRKGSSRSPSRKGRGSPNRNERDLRRDRELSPSPKKTERETDRNHKRSSSSDGEISNGGLNPGKKASPEYNHLPSLSPQREEGEAEPQPQNQAPDGSTHSDAESPPPDRYGSQSPLAREKS